jgi:hypothetical protein
MPISLILFCRITNNTAELFIQTRKEKKEEVSGEKARESNGKARKQETPKRRDWLMKKINTLPSI